MRRRWPASSVRGQRRRLCGQTLPGCHDDRPRPLGGLQGRRARSALRSRAGVLPAGAPPLLVTAGSAPLPRPAPLSRLTDGAVEVVGGVYGCGVPESAYVINGSG
nr:electron transfer flavoprotein regulatory factor 1 isoform X2 [Oryctolagus cuniculus]